LVSRTIDIGDCQADERTIRAAGKNTVLNQKQFAYVLAADDARSGLVPI
jgi:hypothetical protein